MQYYISDNNRKGKRWGLFWTAVYAAGCILLMIFVTFPLQSPQTTVDQGIMINFGDAQEAGGDQDTRLTENVASRPVEAQPRTQPVQHTPSPNGEVEVPQRDRPRQTSQAQPAEQPRQSDPRAMFPGRTAGSTSTSEGTATGQGNQGNPAGSPDGSHSGTGSGTSGTAWNLDGRNIIGSLPKPAYDGRREGKVIVEITVNPQGEVTNAVYRASGSTTNESSLVNEALRAARKARFNNVGSENLQTGTITYVFKMN